MSVLTEGQRLGVYRIVRLLGEGGMGAVYEARQEPLERRVALKTLHADHAKRPEFIERFFNEAKVLSRLEHPSLVQVSDFGHAADGTAYLVMEYLRGQSLARRICDLSERGERLPVETALHVCVQVADVLAMAHGQGIVHRDIKPENLMLVGDPVSPGGERVKVLDFGIAKLTDDRGGVKTARDQVMGTPAYMSPEQCAGAGGVDAQTDVYALGCVLYELLSGKTPFVADGPGRLIAMHLSQEPPTLLSVAPQVPTEIAELVHRMLRKEKTQRPTMKEAAEELARQLSRQPGGTLAARLPVEAITDGDEKQAIARVKQPAGMRSGLVFGGVGVLVMGIVVAVWIGTTAGPKPQPPVQAAKPSIAETAEPSKERLDLATDQPASSGESPKETSKPETVPAPARSASGSGKTEVAPEPKESDGSAARTAREQDSSEETVWI
jgi:serine/threonine protein kinase